MRARITGAALILAALAGPVAAQDAPNADAPDADALIADFEAAFEAGEDIVADIAAMAARDQYLRTTFIARMQQAPSEAVRQDYIDRTTHHFARVGGQNTERLKAILEDMDWAELAALSPKAAQDAFLIVSHTNDAEFKAAVVAEIEPMVRAGTFDGEEYALLVDDLLLADTGMQRYATNFDCEGGAWTPKPTEDLAVADELRAEFGMPSVAESARIMVQIYGDCPAE